VHPKSLFPSLELRNKCAEYAKASGAKLTFTDDVKKATKDADVIYTDVWVSMGEPMEKWPERIKLLKNYQVTKAVMENAHKDAIFLHCLPSFHDTNTTIGKDVYDKFGLSELEVTNEVFESSQSKVMDEAENRLHTIKAVMYATLK
jgi:ornithine carbamoyltransferase